MAASPVIGNMSTMEFVYIIKYHLHPMSDEEKRHWFKTWASLRNKLPKGIRIVTEAGSAFGTDFTGFTVFEGPFEKFQELVDLLEIDSWQAIDRTETIIGTKGLVDPTPGMQKILDKRPVD